MNATEEHKHALVVLQQWQQIGLTLQASSRSSSNGSHHSKRAAGMTLEELRAVNRYAESTKSLSYLPQVKNDHQQ